MATVTLTETPPVDAVGIAELWYPNPTSIVDSNIWANGTAELVEIMPLAGAIGTALLMVYVGITKAFLHDVSSGYTDYTTEANEATADDVPLLPASIGANDAFYYLAGFYGDTTIYGLYIDVTTAGQGTYTLAWEYYNGSTWVSIEDYIITFGSIIDYKTTGINKIDISKPSDIADVDLNGILAKFIRARYVSGTVTTQPLAKQIFVYEVANYEVSSETYDETNKLQVLLAVGSETDAQVNTEQSKLATILVQQIRLDSLVAYEQNKPQTILVVQTKTDGSVSSETRSQVILVVQTKTDAQVLSELTKSQVILVVHTLLDSLLYGELDKTQIILVVQTEIDGQIETENKEQVIIVVPTESDIMNHLETNNLQVILVVVEEKDFFARKLVKLEMTKPHLKFVMKRP